MKRLLVAIMMFSFLIISSVCYAAEGGSLNKQQSAIESFLQGVGGIETSYSTVANGFDPELKQKITAESYVQLQKTVKEQFGSLKECKFFEFRAYDEFYSVIYLASFSKEKIVNASFRFSKNNKMLDFALSPIKEQAK